MNDFHGRIALVKGASSGIGLALAHPQVDGEDATRRAEMAET